MIIQKNFPNKSYTRKIEGMGKGLALFHVTAVYKEIGQNYHLFYADKRKPPLDIAINPNDDTIEYISCFVQDEVIERSRIENEIIDKGIGISIMCKDFNENNVHITVESEFKFVISDNNIWILRTGYEKLVFYEYGLDKSNGILCADNQFYGMILKNLTREEIQELDDSNCLIKSNECDNYLNWENPNREHRS